MGDIRDAANKQWHDFWLHAINNPKTSLIGLFSFLSITFAVLAPAINHHVIAGILSLVSALVRAYLGLLLRDPGKVSVVTPDNPVPHPESSTEVPLNPEATVVIQN